MTKEEMLLLRDMMREEVTAAVAPINQRLDALEKRIDERLDNVEGRLNKVDERLDTIDERLDTIDERLDTIEENTTITREAVNTLIELADDASIQIVPLFRRKAN